MDGFVGCRNIAVHANYCGNATAWALEGSANCPTAQVGFREEIEHCTNLPPCVPDVDCATSEWAQWTDCSRLSHVQEQSTLRLPLLWHAQPLSLHLSICIWTWCGPHNCQLHLRSLMDPGATCDNETLKEIEPCNPGPDEVRPADCRLANSSRVNLR